MHADAHRNLLLPRSDRIARSPCASTLLFLLSSRTPHLTVVSLFFVQVTLRGKMNADPPWFHDRHWFTVARTVDDDPSACGAATVVLSLVRICPDARRWPDLRPSQFTIPDIGAFAPFNNIIDSTPTPPPSSFLVSGWVPPTADDERARRRPHATVYRVITEERRRIDRRGVHRLDDPPPHVSTMLSD